MVEKNTIQPINLHPHHCDVFDRMTAAGWKLNLIGGFYYR